MPSSGPPSANMPTTPTVRGWTSPVFSPKCKPVNNGLQWHGQHPGGSYSQLYMELNESPDTAQSLDWATDIRWILREEAYPELYTANSD